MKSNSSSQRTIRTILAIAFLIALLAVILVQQSRIRELQTSKTESNDRATSTHSTRSKSASGDMREFSAATNRKRPDEDLLAQAREEHLETVENQLKEISAPLAEDMASTMFNAEIKEGQSLVTGGYQTADGKNQFTILKPSVIRTPNGSQQIQIASKLIALSQDDTKNTGLDTLATNAKNTLQHAESWEESDVSSTMEQIQNSQGSDYLGEPTAIVAPGEKFNIEMTSDDRNSYTLAGTAELSPTGSGVILKARIQQKEAPKDP
jgi:hypothetical protein